MEIDSSKPAVHRKYVLKEDSIRLKLFECEYGGKSTKYNG